MQLHFQKLKYFNDNNMCEENVNKYNNKYILGTFQYLIHVFVAYSKLARLFLINSLNCICNLKMKTF